MQANELHIAEPILPRQLKAPRRYEVGVGDGMLPPSPEDHYRSIYFEAINTVTACIKNRFKQEGYQMYCRVEQLSITEGQPEEEIHEVLKFYGSDFEKEL